jgi:hypothetical protein
MPNLMFGMMGNTGVPADEKVVRSTATPVQEDAPAAVESDSPQWNEEPETDNNPNLGIVNRTKASHWVQGEKYPPFWQAEVDNQAQHNLIIDQQVSTSGTAAAREAAGQFGHGSASYAVGIEPVGDLREGGKMGNDYFSAGKPDIQSTAGSYMSVPPGYDQITTSFVNATGKEESRKAGANRSPYDDWWNGGS